MNIRLIVLIDGAKDERRDGRMQIKRDGHADIGDVVIVITYKLTGYILDACNTAKGLL